MSDYIDKEGKRYYAEEYLNGANKTAKRRQDEIERRIAEVRRKDAEVARLRKALTEIKGIPTYLQSRRDNYANKVHKAHDIAREALADTEEEI